MISQAVKALVRERHYSRKVAASYVRWWQKALAERDRNYVNWWKMILSGDSYEPQGAVVCRSGHAMSQKGTYGRKATGQALTLPQVLLHKDMTSDDVRKWFRGMSVRPDVPEHQRHMAAGAA